MVTEHLLILHIRETVTIYHKNRFKILSPKLTLSNKVYLFNMPEENKAYEEDCFLS